jgi:hypothetical protein
MDDRNIPYGCERVAYDADTETCTYLDTNTGRYYTTTPGMRYGTLEPNPEPEVPKVKTKRKVWVKVRKDEETTSPLQEAFFCVLNGLALILAIYEEKKKRRREARERIRKARDRFLDEPGYYV